MVHTYMLNEYGKYDVPEIAEHFGTQNSYSNKKNKKSGVDCLPAPATATAAPSRPSRHPSHRSLCGSQSHGRRRLVLDELLQTELLQTLQLLQQEFFLQNNIAIMNAYDILFDPFCEVFCKIMKIKIREGLMDYRKESLEKRRPR
jgi:hypothetical protein